jgi:predicted HD superfamily hydrolase involved in NAD metabolism
MVSQNNKINNFDIYQLIDKEIINKLKGIIDKKRFFHSLNVAKIAVILAYKFKVNKKKAALAGLLHDCAKTLSLNKSKKYLFDFEDDILKDTPAIWHSYAGYFYAKKVFNVKDKKILNAIKYHTVGFPDMDKLAKIIYVADFIEFGRDYVQSKKISKLIRKRNLSLDNMVLLVLKEKLLYLLKNRKKIHINSIKLYNKLLKK